MQLCSEFHHCLAAAPLVPKILEQSESTYPVPFNDWTGQTQQPGGSRSKKGATESDRIWSAGCSRFSWHSTTLRKHFVRLSWITRVGGIDQCHSKSIPDSHAELPFPVLRKVSVEGDCSDFQSHHDTGGYFHWPRELASPACDCFSFGEIGITKGGDRMYNADCRYPASHHSGPDPPETRASLF